MGPSVLLIISESINGLHLQQEVGEIGSVENDQDDPANKVCEIDLCHEWEAEAPDDDGNEGCRFAEWHE